MPREIAIFGLVIPTLLPLFVFSLLVLWQVDRFMRRKLLYAKVAHPALFRLLLAVIIFCLLGLAVY